MKIHHLSCGSMCPYGGKLVSGEAGSAEIVCHVLLIETSDSLVLVDTGIGTDDVAHPHRRLGPPFAAAFRPKAVLEETALHRVRALGFDPADVHHIACTHLDLDHAGGLPDFPAADVHVFELEQAAALKPSLRDRPRYPKSHFSHGPRWAPHGPGGDRWFGFESIRLLPGVDPEILLIPLPGHSRGHCAVAVNDASAGQWLLHCGDAYFNRAEIATPPSCPPFLRAFQNAVAFDNSARKNNQGRLRELSRDHGDEIRLFCAHDPVELAHNQARTAASA